MTLSFDQVNPTSTHIYNPTNKRLSSLDASNKSFRHNIKMLFSTMLASVALPILAAATPIDLERRAGGPAIVPLAANCTLMNPLPHASQHPGNGTISGYVPSSSFSASKVYSWYIPQPDFLTREARWSNCIEQCNGYSGCVSAYMAYNAPLPKGWLGLPGGELEVGCFMYNRTLTPLDFVVATEGQYVNATAGNIYCPKAGSASATASSNASAAKSTGTTKKKPVKVVA
ncbi:hypothetical protein D6C97_07471 [Aureobasidium pullulans]|uniref:Uncharacterized protein n=1 Tax=Aureobasidium pullulans TaxID=5580 RepID=A0A4S9AXE8_AURPU|nr:hypothetical protein D6D15_08485 [Aureobasidium pullulans]THY49004.1 hypothetical protein D6C97_07471 [Aureobasidium pullulans]